MRIGMKIIIGIKDEDIDEDIDTRVNRKYKIFVSGGGSI